MPVAGSHLPTHCAVFCVCRSNLWTQLSCSNPILGDDRGWPQQRVWVCMLFIPRRGHQGRDRNERADCQHKASLRRARSKERGAESNPHQPVHAEIGHHEGPAWPSPGLFPDPPRVLPTPHAPGESCSPVAALHRDTSLPWSGLAVGLRGRVWVVQAWAHPVEPVRSALGFRVSSRVGCRCSS